VRANDAIAPSKATAPALRRIGALVDAELEAFLARERSAAGEVHADAAILVDELARLVGAGGKRVRPALCYWGYRAGGGDDGRPIVLVSAALELLHTFALVHDDVMDASAERRGIASVHEHAAATCGRSRHDAREVGRSVAILAGDLAAVYADRLMFDSGFAPDRLVRARRIYDAMRVDMAVGQLLDVVAAYAADESLALGIARLKTGSYTIEGPLAIGAALAGAPGGVEEALAAYARPLGQAFQLRDDLDDEPPSAGEASAARARIEALVDEASRALDDGPLPSDAAKALREVAELVAADDEPGSDGSLQARGEEAP
jgi:geranylgeranyl diphosphate synthase, type I